ncbi:hypothetical protein LOK49_LG02G02308 [Camellia lanceoleosa]|uniref:Uncharacterized protein n=1 Tax=Camellia lanceoleosa TaxID=1840588 RepID=A0ACC0INK9_9ERIC|nr:hypothetical protein LOK49_LG02G02308 [Camellia lanceoleosa]
MPGQEEVAVAFLLFLYYLWGGDLVQERFQLLKKRKDTGSFTEQDFDEQILKQQQEEEERKRHVQKERKRRWLVPYIWLIRITFLCGYIDTQT